MLNHILFVFQRIVSTTTYYGMSFGHNRLLVFFMKETFCFNFALFVIQKFYPKEHVYVFYVLRA